MSHLVDATGAGLWLLAGWSIRWGVLIAGLAVWLRARPPRRAASRHRLVAATLAAGLLLPAAPSWPVPRRPPPIAVEPARPIASTVAAPHSREWIAPPDADAPPRPAAPSPIGPPTEGRGRPDRPGAGELAVLGLGVAWLSGAGLVAARLLAGGLVLCRLRRSSAPLADPAHASFEAALAESGVRRRVELASHRAVGSPVALGGRSPVILVPGAWGDWPEAARRACLLHELAHLGRRDDAWKLLAELARVPFWFHPGVGWLVARLDREAELAADEAAVGRGVAPRDLARLLLDCARLPHRLDPRALAFSGTRTISARISRLLEDDMIPTSLPPARPRPLGLAAAVVALAAIAGARVRAVEPSPPIARTAEPAQDPAPPPVPASPASAFAVKIVDESGRPIEGATVVLREPTPPRLNEYRAAATVHTDRDGLARFDRPRRPGRRILAYKSGYCYQSSGLSDASGQPVESRTLAPGRVVAGVVTDPERRPIADAEVRVTTTIRTVRGGSPAFGVALGVSSIQLSSPESDLKGTPIAGAILSRTDAAGRFRFDLLPDDPQLALQVAAAGKALAQVNVAMDSGGEDARTLDSVAIEMPPEARVAVRVVSRVPGLGVAGRLVLIRPEVKPGQTIFYQHAARTDAEGQVEVGQLAGGDVGVALGEVPADVPWFVRSPERPVARPGETTQVTIELIEKSGVSGRLVTADGRPAPGVEVSARHVDRLSGEVALAARTDEEGRFWFRLPPGPASVSLDGFASPFKLAEDGEEGRRFDVPEAAMLALPPIVVMPRPRSTVRVVDAAGEPVAGAAVSVWHDNRFIACTAGVSDPRGEVVMFETPAIGPKAEGDRPIDVRVALADGRLFDSAIERGRDRAEATIRLPATAGAKP